MDMTRRRILYAGAALSAIGARGVSSHSVEQDAVVSLAYFGAHFHRLVLAPGEAGLPTYWPDGMAGSIRLWDSGTRWGDIAPRAGVWKFDRMDAYVAIAQTHSADVLYTLGSTPQWASARPQEPGPYGPGCAAEPVRLAHWEEYVERVATRYRGRIQAYELWNEPQFSDYAPDRQYPGFFTGSVAQMVELARSARRVLDRIDPTASLTTPGFVNGPHRLDLFLRSGGAEFVQKVAYHVYARDAQQFMAEVRDVRRVMRTRRVEALALWNTECGVESHSDPEPPSKEVSPYPTESRAAANMAQFLLIGAAERLDRFFYYAWDNDRSGLVDRVGTRRPRFEAMQRIERWLLGTNLSEVQTLADSVFVVQGRRDEERFVFAWSAIEKSVRLPMPTGWRISSRETLLSGAGPEPADGSPAADWTLLSAAPVRLTLIRQ